MGIYETGFLLDGRMMTQKKFYNQQNTSYDQLRNNLLSVIYSFVRDAFSTELQSFNTDNYIVLILAERLDDHVLMMFCIIEKKTRTRAILNRMRIVFGQFLERFNRNDILTRDPGFFAEFSIIFEQNFSDLGINSKKKRFFFRILKFFRSFYKKFINKLKN